MELLESCEISSLQKQPFFITPRRLERLSWRNAPSGEERGYVIVWNGAKPLPQGVSLGNKER